MGYALVDVMGRRPSYVESGTLNYSKIRDYFDRLPKMFQHLREILGTFSPDEIALESLIYVKSPSSLIKLAHARGAVMASFCEDKYRGKVFEYAPNFVKRAVSGHGHTSKEGIEKAVSLILGVKVYESSDESDALAIALCHSLCSPSQSQKIQIQEGPI